MYGQAPQGINYQGVARNQLGVALSNKSIGVKMSIHDSALHKVLYTETYTTNTNTMGLFTHIVGRGTNTYGKFDTIDWSTGNKWIKIDIDPNGGTNYSVVGDVELMSVPYALFAKSAGNNLRAGPGIMIINDSIINIAPDTKTIYFAGNGILIQNDTIYNTTTSTPINITGQGGINVSGNYPNYTIQAVDSSNTNELQILSLSNDTLYLSNGNYIILSAYKDNTDSQQLSKAGKTIILQNGSSVDLNDDDSTNELQALNLSNDTLLLSNANYINLALYKDNTDSQTINSNKIGNQVKLTISGGNNITFSVDDADADSTNELQTISKNNNNISLNKNGGTIMLNDDDSTNELQTISISNDTLRLSKGGGSVNINNFPLPSDSSSAVNAKAAIVNYLSYGSATSNNNIYNITLPVMPSSYQAGMMLTFMADSANTDTVSVNVNGLGIKRLKKLVSNELSANDILMGQMVIIVFDGRNFQMMSTPSNTLKSPAENRTLIYTTDGF